MDRVVLGAEGGGRRRRRLRSLGLGRGRDVERLHAVVLLLLGLGHRVGEGADADGHLAGRARRTGFMVLAAQPAVVRRGLARAAQHGDAPVRQKEARKRSSGTRTRRTRRSGWPWRPSRRGTSRRCTAAGTCSRRTGTSPALRARSGGQASRRGGASVLEAAKTATERSERAKTALGPELSGRRGCSGTVRRGASTHCCWRGSRPYAGRHNSRRLRWPEAKH